MTGNTRNNALIRVDAELQKNKEALDAVRKDMAPLQNKEASLLEQNYNLCSSKHRIILNLENDVDRIRYFSERTIDGIDILDTDSVLLKNQPLDWPEILKTE